MIADNGISTAAMNATFATTPASNYHVTSISTSLMFSDESAVGRFIANYVIYLGHFGMHEVKSSDKITFKMRNDSSVVVIHIDGLAVTIEKK